MMKKRSEFGLGSAFFGISDPGLVKKTFFKVFFHKKLTRASGDEILEIFPNPTDVLYRYWPIDRALGSN